MEKGVAFGNVSQHYFVFFFFQFQVVQIFLFGLFDFI